MPTVCRGTIFSLFSGVSVLEDFADRLSHVWTFWLLLILASVISWNQQSFNSPIQCFAPAEFTEAMVEYTHTTCWSGYHQYRANNQDDIPSYHRHQAAPKLWMYKWLPVLLCIQALLFKLPNIIMHVLHGHSGVSFDKIAGLTAGYQNLNLMERSCLGKQTGRYLYNWCKQCENCLPFRVLSIVWCFVKLLFCANVIVQFVLIDKFLNTRKPPDYYSTSFGDVIYANLFRKEAIHWTESRVFPRRIMCDYSVRRLRNVEQYSLQCDLPFNEFNEYIYMGLWIWFLVVAVINCLSFVVWLVRTVVPFGRERYISRMVELSYELNPNQLVKRDVTKLVEMIGEDGVMVLKLIASNSSELLVRDAVTTMFQMKHIQSQTNPLNVPEVATYPTAHASASTYTPLLQAGMQSAVHDTDKE